jgi:hypothetical protein
LVGVGAENGLGRVYEDKSSFSEIASYSKTVRRFLERLADKDILIDSIFGDDQKK